MYLNLAEALTLTAAYTTLCNNRAGRYADRRAFFQLHGDRLLTRLYRDAQ